MAGRLSSHRFRRRVLWTLVAGGMTAAVIGAIKVGNTGRSSATPIDHTKPAWVYHPPPHLYLTKADRLELFDTATKFVVTAVARKHLDSAWDMLGPEMKAGQTRKTWDTGFNNVIPFPADGIQSWAINYSYEDDVALDLSLFHRGKGSNWSGKTFTIELKKDVSHAKGRWLVVSWVPKGIGGGGTLSPNRPSAGPPPPGPKAQVSGKWLLFPLLFLGMLAIVLGAWGVASVVKGRRASRRYAQSLGYK
jgi:hypothetical protein